MNPSAPLFAGHSSEYLQAARRLTTSQPFLFHPTFYCALHAIELALKAHLALLGYSPDDLRQRRFGHNLEQLLRTAADEGGIDDSVIDYFDAKAVEWGSTDYQRKCFEYPEPMVSSLPIGRWCQIGEKLLSAAKDKIEDAQQGGAANA
jgi:hypothetical protein